MSLMPWDLNKFDVHVHAMNNDHEHIVELINRIHDADAAGTPANAVLRVLDELGAFTTEHFAGEEQLMEYVGYADLPRHRVMHQQLLREFTKHRNAFAAEGGRLPKAFFDFLKLWLTAHIRNIDMRYGEFVEAQHPELLDVA